MIRALYRAKDSFCLRINVVIYDGSYDGSDRDPPVRTGEGDGLVLLLVYGCGQPELDLPAAQIVDVSEDSVDEVQYTLLGLVSTITKVFDS